MSNQTKSYANGRCCVFQPFDQGDFDKRFDDILTPAIEAAEMEAYRVDRDPQSVIPVDTLHSEIRLATICVADITTRNPNVMYELGYAIAAEKDVVIISSSTERHPFDIQHRGIIPYHTGSTSDFDRLGKTLTAKILAVLDRQEKTGKVVSTSPVRKNEGLDPHEITALAFVLANTDALGDTVSASTLKEEMRKANYSETGTRLALSRLSNLAYVSVVKEEGDWGHTYYNYALTALGENWLLDNQSKLELSAPSNRSKTYSNTGITNDDIPF